jgi:hypothetical protein
MQTSAVTLANVEKLLAGVAKHVITRSVADPLWTEMGTLDRATLDRYRVQDD